MILFPGVARICLSGCIQLFEVIRWKHVMFWRTIVESVCQCVCLCVGGLAGCVASLILTDGLMMTILYAGPARSDITSLTKSAGAWTDLEYPSIPQAIPEANSAPYRQRRCLITCRAALIDRRTISADPSISLSHVSKWPRRSSPNLS